jgi:hypothetical protein
LWPGRRRPHNAQHLRRRGGIVDSSDPSSLANSPFLVGVSGHRDLQPADLPRLREAVTSFVCQLKEHLPDTELRLIVGMAEGADLLVAETAVALDVAVEAVLPMPLEHYAADFDPRTFDCLQELLRHPHVRCVELSFSSMCDGVWPVAHSPAQRDAMYANLTDALIRRSSLLLALWDGKVSPLAGGTADTVLRYLGLRTDEHAGPETLELTEAHEEADAGERMVYWTPAGRSGGDAVSESQQPCFLWGTGDGALQMQYSMPAPLRSQLAQLNHYNVEFRQLTDAGGLSPGSSLIGTLPESLPLPDRRMLEHMDAQYRKADALAVYYQLRSDRLFHLFGIMAFAMGLAYLVYEKLTEDRIVLIAYVLILLSSLGVYYVLQGKRWFGKHLTYRALAETLRARFYLRLAGADRSVDAAEVLALSGIDRFHGFGWIAFVLKGIEPPDVAAGPRGDPASFQGFIEQAWIENQHAYFTRKVARLETSSRRMKRLRQTIFVVILATIAVLFLFGDALHGIDLGLGVPLKNVLTFTMGLLAVLLGVWELHQDKMATRELLWQYRNQLTHFSRARAQLSRMSSPRGRTAVLAELGKDSLMESYLWAIHRYHREHEPPTAGG